MHESLAKYEQQQEKPKEKGKPTCTKVSQNTSSSRRNQTKKGSLHARKSREILVEQQQEKPKEKGSLHARKSREIRAAAREINGKGKPTCTKVSQNTSSSKRNQRKREAYMYESLPKYSSSSIECQNPELLPLLPIASSTLPQACLGSCRTLRKRPFGVFRMFFVIDLRRPWGFYHPVISIRKLHPRFRGQNHVASVRDDRCSSDMFNLLRKNGEVRAAGGIDRC